MSAALLRLAVLGAGALCLLLSSPRAVSAEDGAMVLTRKVPHRSAVHPGEPGPATSVQMKPDVSSVLEVSGTIRPSVLNEDGMSRVMTSSWRKLPSFGAGPQVQNHVVRLGAHSIRPSLSATRAQSGLSTLGARLPRETSGVSRETGQAADSVMRALGDLVRR